MSMYEKWNQGTLSRDAEALIACLHDDFTFVRHQAYAINQIDGQSKRTALAPRLLTS